jgi:D-3-phosphoglycerate dehydrogenase
MKIIISDDYQRAIESLECFNKIAHHDVVIHNNTVIETEDLVKRFHEAEGIVLIRQRTKINEDLLSKLPNLKIISATGANYAGHIDVEACSKYKVAVAAGGSGTRSTCELAWGLILSHMRSIPKEISNLKNGGWQSTLGEDLNGKTIGIYAYGKIGKQMAQIANAFNMNVLIWGRESSMKKAQEDGFNFAENRESFFSASDIISIHLPFKKETKGIITSEDFALMKKNSVFVNTSRAKIIKSGDLEKGLLEGRPGYACVDVYDEEPIYNSQNSLIKMKNTLCTPHLGYVTRGTYEKYFGLAFDQINAFFEGKPINLVNPEILK